jgi:hypothetical protein
MTWDLAQEKFLYRLNKSVNQTSQRLFAVRQTNQLGLSTASEQFLATLKELKTFLEEDKALVKPDQAFFECFLNDAADILKKPSQENYQKLAAGLKELQDLTYLYKNREIYELKENYVRFTNLCYSLGSLLLLGIMVGIAITAVIMVSMATNPFAASLFMAVFALMFVSHSIILYLEGIGSEPGSVLSRVRDGSIFIPIENFVNKFKPEQLVVEDDCQQDELDYQAAVMSR